MVWVIYPSNWELNNPNCFCLICRTTRGRDSIYDLKARREGSDRKSNFVSYAVLAVVALFFIVLAVVYLGMASDTSVISSGKAPNEYVKL